MEGLAEVLHTMAVNDNAVEAKGIEASTVDVHVMPPGSCLALSKPVGKGGREEGGGGGGRNYERVCTCKRISLLSCLLLHLLTSTIATRLSSL